MWLISTNLGMGIPTVYSESENNAFIIGFRVPGFSLPLEGIFYHIPTQSIHANQKWYVLPTTSSIIFSDQKPKFMI
jgi:hypothetical protein